MTKYNQLIFHSIGSSKGKKNNKLFEIETKAGCLTQNWNVLQ